MSRERGQHPVVVTGGRRTALLFVLLTFVAACARPVEPPPPPDYSTPAGYQQLLDRTDREVADAVDAIGRAPALDGLDETVLAAAGAVSAAAERLTSGPVPAAVAADNTALADGLRQFGRELGYLSQQIHLRAICAGPAAVAAISTAPSTPGLRAVAAGLATERADRPAFRWGAALPAPTAVPEPRLPNGTIVTDRRVSGSPGSPGSPPGSPASPGSPGPAGSAGEGALEVRNEGSRDAVVQLARDDSVLVALAVSAGAAARLDTIPDGDYQLFYTTGRGWDARLGTFNRQCDFHRFVEPTSLRSTPVPGGTAYTVQTITLRDPPAPDPETGEVPDPGPGGPTEVPPAELPR